jgi:hypothetical protein
VSMESHCRLWRCQLPVNTMFKTSLGCMSASLRRLAACRHRCQEHSVVKSTSPLLAVQECIADGTHDRRPNFQALLREAPRKDTRLFRKRGLRFPIPNFAFTPANPSMNPDDPRPDQTANPPHNHTPNPQGPP